ncbi:MAG: ABC transporter substrate-binding protein [Acidimicrobiales bacterium]
MSKKLLIRWLSAVLALGMLAAACGSDRDDDTATDAGDTTTTAAAPDEGDGGDEGEGGDDTTTTEAAPETDPCEGVTLEATDTGVTEDTIKVIVMADVDSPLAPGLFAGSRDGVLAWADAVNANGGLACRQVEAEFHDSKLDGTQTVAGFLKACDSALALVGTTVLFGLDTADLNSCPNANGDPIGVADIAYITTEVPHQCSANSFHLSRPGATCPYEGGDREYTVATGAQEFLAESLGVDFNGVFIVPADLPSTVASAVPITEGQAQAGVTWDAIFGASGAATQAEYGQYVAAIRENGSNYVYNGSNDQAMLKMKREAAVQGIDVDSITWLCSLSCYTPAFIEEGGADAEGVYVWMFFLPFEEADTNENLSAFLDGIGTDFPPAWAAGAWMDGLLFEQSVNRIVDRDGPNGVTRQSLLDELAATESFDAGGWVSPADFSTTNAIGNCFVLLQVQNGEYVRVQPTERGELDCSYPGRAVTANPETFELD